ncbi:hypothetical protein ACJRO7_033554 [Eucalyptus globulus]|uniref:Pentatricopeptide repeat-containing protein n=1 Tax=Eucalyptus globulus TaxID=34317 RepID=A0ABD3JRW2_EUCGL
MARHARVTALAGNLSFATSTPFTKLLDGCGLSKSARDTRRVHARIIKTRFSAKVFIQNWLIHVYVRCGCLDDARRVFDRMPEKNTFTWNAILGGLIRSGSLDEAEKIFGSMPEPDQCSWNSMLSGYAQHERFEEALQRFRKMHRENYVLNEYSFGSALRACARLADMHMGQQIQALISKSECSSDVHMGSALIDMYSKCGNVAFSWNSLITCYEQNGPASEALEVFVSMMDCGFEIDEVTLASVVSAYASLSALKEGMQIHARVVKCDKFRNDVVLGNALVDMYSECSRISEARAVFDRMPTRNIVSATSMVSGYAKAASLKTARVMFTRMMEKNVVSRNALIAGYTQNGQNEEAFGLFHLLKREAIEPTHYTFGNLLNACANLADLQLGQQAHAHVLKHGFRFQSGEESDIFVGNSLIDMYVNCGAVEDGLWVFKNMLERDKVSWNAIIVGYAQNGYGIEALEIFRKMLVSGERPDRVTMIRVLCACSHAGLVEEGRHYFKQMVEEYDLAPVKDHYTCMVDLLGQASCLSEAKDLIETMPMQPDAVVWGSLLAACKVHKDITLGKYVAEKLLEIDPSNSGPYILLSNMYAECKKWGEVVRVRKLMRQRGVVKQPGCSWIEIQGQVHVFIVKDKRLPHKGDIYSLLRSLLGQMKQDGYIAITDDYDAYEELSESDLMSYDEELSESDLMSYEMEMPVDAAVC